MLNRSNPTIYCQFRPFETARARILEVFPESRIISREELDADPALSEDVEIAAAWPITEASLWPAVTWLQAWSAGVSPQACANARERGITVTNTSGIHAEPMAEQALAMMLIFARKMQHILCAESWDSQIGSHKPGVLSGSTLGIVGLGAIGRRLAELARVIGMRLVAVKRSPVPEAGFDWVGGQERLHDLASEADYVFNVLPLTAETTGIISTAFFASMKPSAVYLNFGRGGTTDTNALVAALRAGTIAGAGLDVTDPEPLPDGHPLWTMDNVIITPHYSGQFKGYNAAAMEVFLDNLRRYRDGKELRNVVDTELCY